MMWRRLGRPCQPGPLLASCEAGKLDRATLFADRPTRSRDGILQEAFRPHPGLVI